MRLFIPCFLSFCLFLFLPIGANAKILFTSWGSNRMISVMDDDGSNVTLLTEHKRPWHANWSPDGKYIVFNGMDSDALLLMNADGSGIREITTPPSDGRDKFGSDSRGAFSPDGTSILFSRHIAIHAKEDKHSLNVLNLETGRIKEIAKDISVTSPHWSPDGKYIVCATGIDVDGLGSSIWRMTPEGGDLRKLVSSQRVGNSILSVSRPKWSPNSQKIVYSQMRYSWRRVIIDGKNVDALIREEFRYFICDKNGNTLQRLNIPKHFDPGGIDWMDNGHSIVFSASQYPINEPPPPRDQYPVLNIYTFHIQSGQLTQLTDTPDDEDGIDWISDDVLPVSPLAKKKVPWGALKK